MWGRPFLRTLTCNFVLTRRACESSLLSVSQSVSQSVGQSVSWSNAMMDVVVKTEKSGSGSSGSVSRGHVFQGMIHILSWVEEDDWFIDSLIDSVELIIPSHGISYGRGPSYPQWDRMAMAPARDKEMPCDSHDIISAGKMDEIACYIRIHSNVNGINCQVSTLRSTWQPSTWRTCASTSCATMTKPKI